MASRKCHQNRPVHFIYVNWSVFDFIFYFLFFSEKKKIPCFLQTTQSSPTERVFQFMVQLKNRNVLCCGTTPNLFGTTEASSLSHFNRQRSRKTASLYTAVYCVLRRRERKDRMGLMHTC